MTLCVDRQLLFERCENGACVGVHAKLIQGKIKKNLSQVLRLSLILDPGDKSRIPSVSDDKRGFFIGR